jgi:hypothetical protein
MFYIWNGLNFRRLHRQQGRNIRQGQRIHGSLINPPKKYKSRAKHWDSKSNFMQLIKDEAVRYCAGTPGQFWEIDDYERARIFLSAIKLDVPEGIKPEENVLEIDPQTSELDIIFL